MAEKKPKPKIKVRYHYESNPQQMDKALSILAEKEVERLTKEYEKNKNDKKNKGRIKGKSKKL